MSIEEIICVLDEMAVGAEDAAIDKQFSKETQKEHRRNGEAIRQAISLLKTHTDNQPNEPLTLEELREMDGQPVYLAFDRKWYIVSINYDLPHGVKQPCGVDRWGAGTSLRLLAECGVYRRPPKEETP